jgi:3-phenylpropionate/trans-cinnamate dioxygenase ferredoxin subunit
MNYVKVARTSDLAPGSKTKISLESQVILLVNIDGAYYAIDNKCPHLGGSLYDGILNADVISCPRHGAAFNVKTGNNVGDAKIAFLKMKVKDAKSLPLKVEGEDILVGIE